MEQNLEKERIRTRKTQVFFFTLLCGNLGQANESKCVSVSSSMKWAWNLPGRVGNKVNKGKCMDSLEWGLVYIGSSLLLPFLFSLHLGPTDVLPFSVDR